MSTEDFHEDGSLIKFAKSLRHFYPQSPKLFVSKPKLVGILPLLLHSSPRYFIGNIQKKKSIQKRILEQFADLVIKAHATQSYNTPRPLAPEVIAKRIQTLYRLEFLSGSADVIIAAQLVPEKICLVKANGKLTVSPAKNDVNFSELTDLLNSKKLLGKCIICYRRVFINIATNRLPYRRPNCKSYLNLFLVHYKIFSIVSLPYILSLSLI